MVSQPTRQGEANAVPYIVHESDMARLDMINRRTVIAAVATIVAISAAQVVMALTRRK